ncbi:MAG: DUF4209 domain-containing protein [Candidatus Aegiribacteria sp.]|nr:DUF4209 domain-containing protein [Candidatus Aegiribacteria sp.]
MPDRKGLLVRLVEVISRLEEWNGQPLLSHLKKHMDSEATISINGLNGVIRKWSKCIGRDLTQEENAERLAFTFRSHIERAPQVDSPWGTYYGPIFSDPDAETDKYFPDISEVTTVTIAYWKQRADEETHPIVKARYADIVWDLENHITSKPKDPVYGRIAITSYIQSVENPLDSSYLYCWAGMKRALRIARMMKRSDLEQKVVNTMLQFENDIADDDLPGTWGESYKALIVESPESIDTSIENTIISELLSRFRRILLNPDANPNGIFTGFELLGDYYIKINGTLPDRICILFADWMFKFSMSKEPLAGQCWLIRTYFALCDRKIDLLAEKILLECEKLGLRVVESLKEYKSSTEKSQEELDAHLNAFFSEGTRKALGRIAVSYLIKEAELHKTVSKALDGYVSHLIAPPVEIDCFGRPLNAVKTDDNGDDMMYHEGKRIMSFQIWMMSLTLHEFVERSSEPVKELLEFYFESPCFDESRRSLLGKGIRAFVEKDYISCVSILIPEIEHILRYITRKLEIPSWEPNRGNTFNVKTLGTLLRDDRLKQVMGEMLFEILFYSADTRGFNIRNNFCHGLMQPSEYNETTSAMLIHLLLILGLFREQSIEENQEANTDTVQSTRERE